MQFISLLYQMCSTANNLGILWQSQLYVVQLRGSPKNISLDSKVDEDDIFSSTVNIDYIEPLSKILITNNVKVSADCHKNMIFETNLDKKVISIYMSTQIVSLDKAKG